MVIRNEPRTRREPVEAPAVTGSTSVSRASQQPRVVERGVARTHITPVDPPVSDRGAENIGTEVGVNEGRREIHERLHLTEESSCLRSPITMDDGEHEPFELRALFAVRLDPVVTLKRKPARVLRMERLQECTDPFGILVDERLPVDQAIADDSGSRDEPNDGTCTGSACASVGSTAISSSRSSTPGPREAEHPLVVDDRYLKILPSSMSRIVVGAYPSASAISSRRSRIVRCCWTLQTTGRIKDIPHSNRPSLLPSPAIDLETRPRCPRARCRGLPSQNSPAEFA